MHKEHRPKLQVTEFVQQYTPVLSCTIFSSTILLHEGEHIPQYKSFYYMPWPLGISWLMISSVGYFTDCFYAGKMAVSQTCHSLVFHNEINVNLFWQQPWNLLQQPWKRFMVVLLSDVPISKNKKKLLYPSNKHYVIGHITWDIYCLLDLHTHFLQ